MSKFNFNTQKGFWEWDMGNDEFMVFLEKPVFNIETRNTYKMDYSNVLEQLTDGKQKILTDKIRYETKHYNNDDFDWYRKLVETEKPNFRDISVVNELNDRVVEYHNSLFFNRFEGIMKSCPLKIEVVGSIDKFECSPMIWEYKLSMYLKITLTKTMDLWSKLGNFRDNIIAVFGNLDVSKYSKYDDLFSEVITKFNSYKNADYCDRLNFLGERYMMSECNIGDECYNGDDYMKYIDVMYSRCGVNKQGNPLPNRIYKKNSSETIDSPWSYRGQADYLRTLCKDNKVKRYSKMNKSEMIKKLIAL